MLLASCGTPKNYWIANDWFRNGFSNYSTERVCWLYLGPDSLWRASVTKHTSIYQGFDQLSSRSLFLKVRCISSQWNNIDTATAHRVLCSEPSAQTENDHENFTLGRTPAIDLSRTSMETRESSPIEQINNKDLSVVRCFAVVLPAFVSSSVNRPVRRIRLEPCLAMVVYVEIIF